MLPDAAISVHNATDVAEARRVALDLARDAGVGEEACGHCALVVTELATNLIKHAGGGTVVVRQMAGPAIEILSLDSGPGIADTDRCFTDGFSTGSSSGTGLGAVRRLSFAQEIYSDGSGTVLMARVGTAETSATEFCAISVPYPGETVCGDAWDVGHNGKRVQVTVADGLGHGPLAARASQLAMDSVRQNAFLNPDQVIRLVHPVLRNTRGAALSSALCHLGGNLVEYAGVGNISGYLTRPALPPQRMISVNGTAGMDIRKLQPFRYSWDAGSLLIMHSDGLSSKWSLDRYPGMQSAHPALIAGALFRDHRRMHDDATVVVVRL